MNGLLLHAFAFPASFCDNPERFRAVAYAMLASGGVNVVVNTLVQIEGVNRAY